MKSLVFLAIFLVSRSSSYKSQSMLAQKQSKGGYSNGKMLENRNIFSPRMDYDEWTPLGRGDPLKNDPTYDYVPPVLERVHYWMDPSKRTPDPPQSNSALLVLGSRTEPSFTRPATTPRYQPLQPKESHADSRIDTSSILDPFFKLMDVSQFKLNFNSNSNNHYKPMPNRIQRPHPQAIQKRPQPPQALQRPPYTMLMPPPPPPTIQQSPLTTGQTITSPTRPTTTTTAATSNLPLTVKNATTTIPTTVLANTENVFKPVAISMPGSVESTEKEFQNEIKPSTKYQSRKPTTEGSTEPVHVKKHTTEESRVKQQHANPNLIQNPTTQTQKPTKVLRTTQTTLRTTLPPRSTSPESYFRATTAPPVTTTKQNTLTTDPMFKHYKQPSEPVRGPFYLIIQGHSKVKTYGASKNPVNRLPTSNEIKYDEDDKKLNFERKTRRLPYDAYKQADNDVENSENYEERSLSEEENLENLEDTFPKSAGGSSKKRYLATNRRRKRHTRRLLSEDNQQEASTTDKSDNLDLESLIAVSDDYDPEDVANILLKNEGTQGSGLGNFAFSIFNQGEDFV